MFTRGTCLRASLVCFSVCAVTDDSPTSDETSPAAEGVCSIGILMSGPFVNVFIAAEELWGLKQKRVYLGSLSWLLYAASSA